MLRPSRPMIRPFISSRRQVDDRDRVLGRVVGGDALDGGDDDLAGLLLGLVAGLALDRAGEPDGVVLGLVADRLEEHAPWPRRPSCRETRSRAATCSAAGLGELLAGRLELALACRGACGRAPRACRCAGRAARPGRRRRSRLESSVRFARASSSASRCRRSFSSLASRISSFCWVRASATIRPAFSWAALHRPGWPRRRGRGIRRQGRRRWPRAGPPPRRRGYP